MKQTIFALVDCNNFFVSCERIFRPDLEGKPVVVLSSNDGCAVARSNEAKALGIPMGAPAFKYKDIFTRHNVVKFSANFELYADISRRIIHILSEVTPRTEIYSIDEAFLELSQLADTNYAKLAHRLRHRIWQEVGVPVSIGLATSKTLAKLASDAAKKHPYYGGVVSLLGNNSPNDEVLGLTPIEDVWGVGRRLAPKLRGEGLATAADLRMLSTQRARQLMGVRGEQLVRELRGQTCFGLAALETKPKSIARTRTFGEDTDQFHVLEAAIASFATQAAFRLRASNQLTRRAGLFIMTNRHKPGFKNWTSEVEFDVPTADSGLLIQKLVAAAAKLYRAGQAYHRAGVWLHDFVPDNVLQTDLIGTLNVAEEDKSQRRMQSVDHLNQRYGRGAIRFAAERLAATWQPQQNIRSPHYTTSWDELPVARFR